MTLPQNLYSTNSCQIYGKVVDGDDFTYDGETYISRMIYASETCTATVTRVDGSTVATFAIPAGYSPIQCRRLTTISAGSLQWYS